MQPDDAQFELSNVAIETASEEDACALQRLFEMGCVEGHVPDNDTGADIENLQAAYFDDDGFSCFWVARHEAIVIGMIGVQRHADNVAEIRRLRVHADFRRIGVGSRLMETAVEFCRDRSYLKVVLDTRVEREPAIGLFEKFGFIHARTREVDSRQLIDFYLDMYRDHEP